MKTIRRRRKENKTDYGKRIKLLKSGMPRLIFRRTNKHIIAQYITSKEAEDKVEIGLTSKELLNKGWPEEFKNSLKSIPAAYLTGYLIGKEIQNKKMKTPILDVGMMRNVHKNRFYGFLKGVVDSGLEIKFGEDKGIFPEEDRIKGKNMKKDFSGYFEKIKAGIK